MYGWRYCEPSVTTYRVDPDRLIEITTEMLEHVTLEGFIDQRMQGACAIRFEGFTDAECNEFVQLWQGRRDRATQLQLQAFVDRFTTKNVSPKG